MISDELERADCDVTENDGLYMFIPSANQTTFQHGLLENP